MEPLLENPFIRDGSAPNSDSITESHPETMSKTPPSNILSRLNATDSKSLKYRIFLLFLIIAIFHGLVLTYFFISTISYPILLGLGGVSYLFGLRHAVDSDHIAAIDNITRRLVASGNHTVTTGFWFSLGHSTIVVILCFIITLVSQNIFDSDVHSIGIIIGTSVSILFLFLIAVLNLVVLIDLIKVWKSSSYDSYGIMSIDDLLKPSGGGGVLTRYFAKIFSIISSPLHIYLVGLLFGLSFDTASEIGILSISALTSTQQVPSLIVMSLPLLFLGGMALIDSLDGVFMLYAYGWANIHPLMKLWYNMVVTTVSIIIAVLVGTLELFQIIQSSFDLDGYLLIINSYILGPFWEFIENIDMQIIGIVIISIFVLSLLVSTLLYYYKFRALEILNLSDSKIIVTNEESLNIQKTGSN